MTESQHKPRVQKKFQPSFGCKIFIINFPLLKKSKLAKVLGLYCACLEKLYGRRPMLFKVDVTLTEDFVETELMQITKPSSNTT